MAKIKVYIETDGHETQHWTLAEHAGQLAAMQQVLALFTLLADHWYGNPDLDAIRAGVQALEQDEPLHTLASDVFAIRR